MASRELHIDDYPDLLEKLSFSSYEIKSKIRDFKLAFPQNRNPDVEFRLKIPIFVTPFYDCIRHFKLIPTQEVAYGYYLAFHKEEIEELKRTDLIEDIQARFNRTYPSLMRDFHFNKFIKEHLPKDYRAIYNTALDVVEGIDLLIVSPHANYGICFYTDTNNGNSGRKWKENRHQYADNIIFIELPLNLNKADKCGDFLLYGEKQYRELWNKIIDCENQFIRIIPIYTMVAEEKKFHSYLPFYDIKVACGAFVNGGIPDEIGWIDVETEHVRGNENRFVLRASGDSMLPKIHSGDLCVFERNWGGTHNGHIVLAQSRDYDPDYSGKYTIKQYHSEAKMNDERELEKSIDLLPLNPDYNVIHLNEDEDVLIIGVLVGIIEGGEFEVVDEMEIKGISGFCIHCGAPIDYTFGEEKPAYFCKKCWREWHNAGSDINCKENYCHKCGELKPHISFRTPLCYDTCWQNEKDKYKRSNYK